MYIDMDKMIIACVLLGLIIGMIAIFGTINVKKVEKKLSIVGGSNINDSYALDYNKDIEFLNSIITEYVENTALTFKLTSIDNIGNTEFKQIVAETALNIDKRISTKYRSRMYRYFSEDGFNDYVNDKILVILTVFTMGINNPKK